MDSETFCKVMLNNKRVRTDNEDGERKIQRQIKLAKKVMTPPRNDKVVSVKPLVKSEESKKIKFTICSSSSKEKGKGGCSEASKLMFEEEDKSEGRVISTWKDNEKEWRKRRDYWLVEGMIVKVVGALSGKEYCNNKGVVRKVFNKYIGEIEMIRSKKVYWVDQDSLEPVIPQIGGLVRINNGAYRGWNARLLKLDVHKFCATVQVEKGIYDGRVLKALDYDDICEIADMPGTDYISQGLGETGKNSTAT